MSFRRLALLSTGLAMVAGLAGPAAYALDTVSTAHTGSLPTAGPATAGFGGGPRRVRRCAPGRDRTAGAGTRPGGTAGTGSRAGSRGGARRDRRDGTGRRNRLRRARPARAARAAPAARAARAAWAGTPRSAARW